MRKAGNEKEVRPSVSEIRRINRSLLPAYRKAVGLNQGVRQDVSSEMNTNSQAQSKDVERVISNLPENIHGTLGDPKWPKPKCIAYCDAKARPGYDSMKAHEFEDNFETLRAKVQLLSALIFQSTHMNVYTGAGISTASGISDYATKSSRWSKGKSSGLHSTPTLSHYVLTALHRKKLLKTWIQQNHDGLPQKSGMPQSAMNEIHGSWFDPSNPVVPMSGSLRGDLYTWLENEEVAADLTLAIGTSLCGMAADCVVESTALRAMAGEGLGSVIIGYQRTRLDPSASLRIFGNIDTVMLLLAVEMGLGLPVPEQIHCPPNHMYRVPYSQRGDRVQSGNTVTLNLQIGATLKLVGGPGDGFVGKVVDTPSADIPFYRVAFPCTREGSQKFGKGMISYAMGTWMVDAARRGELARLPVINYKSSTRN